ncbi:MAG: hypothetical protein KDG89_03965 [Geminicoccaceae bacterium]|nr:hypothetical protein [Geminicoccaceae bacterium]
MPLQSQILAVLRRAGLLDLGPAPPCRPIGGGGRGRLWRVDLDAGPVVVKLGDPVQNGAPPAVGGGEAGFLALLGAIRPEAAPRLLHVDPQSGAFVMAGLPEEDHPSLLALARDRRLGARHGQALGDLLAALHRAGWERPERIGAFRADARFHVLRIEPLLLVPAEAHKDAAGPLKRIARRLATTHRGVIHGEAAPENVLFGPRGPVLLDADAAHGGDPAFDAAFLLADLAILAQAWPGPAAAEAMRAFARVWLGRGPAPEALEAPAAELLPALVLGRLAGRLPLAAVPPRLAEGLILRAKALLHVPRQGLLPTLGALRGEGA